MSAYRSNVTKRDSANFYPAGSAAPNHGMPMLRESHRSIRISRSLMIAWVGCMQKALEETVEDPALRLHLAGRFTRMAESLVNA